MARNPRFTLPGIPQHIVQRGNNREPCCFADDDYHYYLEVLGQGCRRYDVQLHGGKPPQSGFLVNIPRLDWPWLTNKARLD